MPSHDLPATSSAMFGAVPFQAGHRNKSIACPCVVNTTQGAVHQPYRDRPRPMFEVEGESPWV